MSKAERTRQSIIEKAAPIFNQKGMAGTAISDIMQATNLAKGGVYGNFENKDEICFEVFNYLLKKLSTEIDSYVQRGTTAREKLFYFLDFYRDNLLRSDLGGCPILNFGVEADDTNPVIKQRVNQAIKGMQSSISDLVKQGTANGEFQDNFNADQFALKMFALLEGGMLIGRIQNSTQQMELITDMLKAEIDHHKR
ncbi:TetR/AcrR family transcriptional regulator [Spirosoma soli]|uniref:TetR/AcrR family transcriptional regulator n=1 Tax=Spirosoma soli TaxID=1770529 RepID=A0ABW5M4N0_9BACT